jgi:predicted RND superfamily exporter protein
MLSQFNGIYHTGLLVGITLVVALISDLVLLPILLGGKSD